MIFTIVLLPFFFQAEDGIRDPLVTGVQTCALPISLFQKRAHRAGPALPSYLALHHAGFSVPPVSPPKRWALTPPFHPCLTSRAFRRRLAGSPARLPPCCAPPAVYSLWHFP